MKTNTPKPKRILAIDPNSRGFGFILMESATMPVDWGVKGIRRQDEARILAKISKLISHYRPDIIVVEDCRGSRRCARVRTLLDGVRHLATTEGLKSQGFSVLKVKGVFRAFHAVTKHEIAHAVAQQLPELALELPKDRKPWMSEDSRMAIFDAAALALTYYYSRPVRSGGAPKPLTPERNAIPVPSTT